MKTVNTTYLGTLWVSLLAVLCIVGCASGPEHPRAALEPRVLDALQGSSLRDMSRPQKPAIALALGGGGLRGFAHLGVLRALEEAGIQPGIVVGTSAGAVVGAAYASGLPPDRIESIARNVKLSSLIDFTFSKSGLMRGDNIAGWIDEITQGRPIEQFPRRFAAVATDLRSGKAVLLDKGAAGAAVQASAAVPGINVPVSYPGGHLVDGGIASLVPVRFARALGADIVIAVDIYCTGPQNDGLAAPTVLLRVMRLQSCLVAAPETAEADILIAPPVSVSGMSAKDEQERAIQAGYEATRAALPRIKSQLSRTTGA